jgi:uncharacterized SAM-binding protein YcdF (DUF218 family)
MSWYILGSMKRRDSHGYALLIPVILGVVLVIGVVGYLVFKFQDTEKTKNSATQPSNAATQTTRSSSLQTLTASWPSYSNQYDGYYMQYPSGWFVEASQRTGSAVVVSNKDLSGSTNTAAGISGTYSIEIYVDNNPKGLGLDQFIADRDANIKLSDGAEVVVTNRVAKTTSDNVSYIYREANSSGNTRYESWLANGSKVFHIAGAVNTNYQDTYNALVATIKFTQ